MLTTNKVMTDDERVAKFVDLHCEQMLLGKSIKEALAAHTPPEGQEELVEFLRIRALAVQEIELQLEAMIKQNREAEQKRIRDERVSKFADLHCEQMLLGGSIKEAMAAHTPPEGQEELVEFLRIQALAVQEIELQLEAMIEQNRAEQKRIRNEASCSLTPPDPPADTHHLDVGPSGSEQTPGTRSMLEARATLANHREKLAEALAKRPDLFVDTHHLDVGPSGSEQTTSTRSMLAGRAAIANRREKSAAMFAKQRASCGSCQATREWWLKQQQNTHDSCGSCQATREWWLEQQQHTLDRELFGNA
jgi:hypothetical protein